MAARRSALPQQVWTLAKKSMKIAVFHQTRSTLYTAIFLPVLVSIYLSVGQRLNQPQQEFGIAEPRTVLSFRDGLDASGDGRNKVCFVNGGHKGGDIEKVIDELADVVKEAGKNATTIENEDDLGYVCRSSIRGTSKCYGALIFHSSPDEGRGGVWNYTIRADSALSSDFKYDDEHGDAQVYVLPFQRAIDNAIIKLSSSSSSDSSKRLPETDAYAFTDLTEEQRKDKQRRDYQKTFIQFLGVTYFAALVGVAYHLPGMMATEREKGMSQLIDAMILTKFDWEPQLIRMLSWVIAFSIVYLPGWIACGGLAGALIWKETNIGAIIVAFILAGIALTSMSLMGASIFKRAQMSGAITSLAYLLLGVLAQALPNPGTAPVIILSILFTPSSFVFLIHYFAWYEREGHATNLVKAPPGANHNVPGIFFLIMFIIQAIGYPVIAGILERLIHGVSSEHRQVFSAGSGAEDAARIDTVSVEGLTQIYRPSLLRRLFSFVSQPRPPTVAVDNLTLKAKHGEILALLGANGSGKSTTLDAIAGISRFTRGNIAVDATGGLGYAPQKNVLWDDMTVEDNIRIFNKLKSPHSPATITQTKELAKAVGLESKINAKAGKLSGGQKRKLQLALMLTGDSAVCCVDEVSSGIDPLSRRKIWDILLAERGSRTIILTTHFLDEADLLADHIAILSKGSLRAEGSSVELKDKLGAGYRVHVLDPQKVQRAPDVPGVECRITHSSILYLAPNSGLAAEVIKTLERADIAYRLAGPTIEDVFLQVAEEVQNEGDLRTGGEKIRPDRSAAKSHDLMTGRRVGFFKQVSVLLRKRFIIIKNNWIPYAIAFIVPIIAAGGTQILVADRAPTGCSPREQSSESGDHDKLKDIINDVHLVAGPRSDFEGEDLQDMVDRLISSQPSGDESGKASLELTTSLSGFENYIEDHRRNVTPGGFWLGDDNSRPTFAYRADQSSTRTALIMQGLLDMLVSNVTIVSSYDSFESPFSSSTGKALQLSIFFSLAMTIWPAFFGLYPNAERRMSVRGLQYSSGARSLPLWIAHILFDYTIIVIPMIIAAIIFNVTSDIWYQGGYLFPVFMLYGLASLLVVYVFSLFLSSQLGTYAAATAYYLVGNAIYFISFLYILTFSSERMTDFNILAGHWVIAAFFPIASLTRAMYVALNVFSTSCSGFELRSYPGAMAAYGGPIMYLSVQILILFAVLLWHDSGARMPFAGLFRRNKRKTPSPAPQHRASDATIDESDQEIQNELARVTDGTNKDGLRVEHLIKEFGDFTAVDNVTFGVEHSEVFALLGPNGAGKSTTISLIRGDIQPSKNGGDVFVENIPVSTQRAAARANLGVCPQFDAIDNMTVVEHLQHYARIRGIADVNRQVEAVIEAVGLQAFRNTMAPHLSGGNKRKLSLGIALTGNPSVILLDEPSSGLDAAAKRVMWRTLDSLVPGRSILLTTHSMEEADALANRAGILAQRMLAVGTVDHLRQRFGDTLHVHLVSRTAPHSSPEEMDGMRAWIQEKLPGAQIESDTYHGQMRFSIPASTVSEHIGGGRHAGRETGDESGSIIGQLIVLLEDNKDRLGISHHSVTPTTLNEVFLTIVGKHDVAEEGYAARPKKKKTLWQKLLWLMKP